MDDMWTFVNLISSENWLPHRQHIQNLHFTSSFQSQLLNGHSVAPLESCKFDSRPVLRNRFPEDMSLTNVHLSFMISLNCHMHNVCNMLLIRYVFWPKE